MTITQALIWAVKKLKQSNITSASLDAEVILAFVLKKSKEFLYTHPENNLSTYQLKTYRSLIKRRVKGEPVAYLIKNKKFYNLNFYVDKNVLIPRPETEILVEKVISICNLKFEIYNLSIADIGTGSGCIAIALAKNLPKAKIYATDISTKALKVARLNAQKHKVIERIKFFQGNLLEPIKNKKIDAVVANLPYLPESIYKNLKFEPRVALIDKNLKIHQKFFKQISLIKYKPKIIFLEIHPPRLKQIKKIISKYLPKYKIEINKDLARLNRVLIISI